MGNTENMDHLSSALSLADDLLTNGVPDRIAGLFGKVPRHLFLPDLLWTEDRRRLDRATEPDEWWDAVYSDQALVTQRDDGRPNGPGVPTSSSSAPTVMARMLMAAVCEPRRHVLEIGTGTGFNAALLSEVVGDDHVTSVEIDPGLAGVARAALREAGYAPGVITGDGEADLPDGAFDRLIATCTFSRIPGAWRRRLVDGGRVVAPWAPDPGLPGGALAVLDAVAPGVLEGRFEGTLSFMWARGQRYVSGPAPDPEATPDRAESRDGDPREPLLEGETTVLLSLLVPQWRMGMHVEPGAVEPYLWVASTGCGSWARLYGDGRVEQSGSRLLVDEFDAALGRWRSWGEPGVERFGLTVDARSGLHRLWHETPERLLWSLPHPPEA
ncbi:methyltransferase domain-containing protein [Nocardiopsis lambiniae]|uniref:Protein-L-isoaspartate O-methyltransferase n=1 Tax=Nocardiopsis lambiniae TaxID=3075539 RepID=A0ABU2M5W2_9ACTN|nr:methyltransferase domain-containing protein [Nocardiopsis sp. DSM 44743]MDT0328036.1 methyltransferase domain-containing protein [Nocardiopsis sp. DSM 44743]